VHILHIRAEIVPLRLTPSPSRFCRSRHYTALESHRPEMAKTFCLRLLAPELWFSTTRILFVALAWYERIVTRFLNI